MLAGSDVVVVARATNAAWTPAGMAVDLEVIRVIKGAPASGLIRVVYPPQACKSSPSARLDYIKGATGLWFMTGTEGEYSAYTRYKGAIPCEGLAGLPGLTQRELPVGLPRVADTPDHRFVLELLATYRAGTESERRTLLREMRGGEFEMVAYPALDILIREVASAGTTPGERLPATCARIWAGDAAEVAKLATSGDFQQLDEEQRRALLWAVHGFHWTGIPQVQALATLAASSVPLELRATAAESLASLHTPESLPALRNMLDDPEERIRHQGTRGLAFFATGEPPSTLEYLAGRKKGPMPSEKYRTVETLTHQPLGAGFGPHEEYYVSFWKKWYDERFPRE